MTGSSKALAGRRVLLVEDDYFIAADLKIWFEQEGAHVLGPVPSVAGALELMASTSDIDAAVLDIDLRDERVYAVADALRVREVPFLFATGYEAVAIPTAYATVPLCQKPVDPRTVAQALFG